jgi:protein ImuA
MSIAPLIQSQGDRVTPEQLHPALWRASQLAHAAARCVDTGHVSLTTQLPGGGWPTGGQIDLLTQQPGIGEIRLLAPALRLVARRRILLISPPHQPQVLAFASLGIAPDKLIWLTPTTSADALWAAEQVLRSGSCGAVLFWNTHARSKSMRRLNLAAQAGESLFFMLRPLAAAQDASPAQLRLALRPAANGIQITFVKRRGPQRDEPLVVPLPSPMSVHGLRLPARIPVGIGVLRPTVENSLDLVN